MRRRSAFVDGKILHGVADLLFAVVRDIAYTAMRNLRQTASST